MKKSINIVLIGVLTVVSILLALPFTPLRNSFKGVTGNVADKALTSMGVDFKGKLKNARQISSAHQYEAANMNLGLTVDSKSRIISYDVNNVSGISLDGYNTNNLSVNEKSGNTAIGLNSTYSGSGRNTANSPKGIGGFVAIQTKAGSVSTTNTVSGGVKQSETAGSVRQAGHGGPPPEELGGGGTPPPSLPIGNGTGFLLMLAVAFATWKVRRSLI